MDSQRTYKLSEITKIFEVKNHFIIHLVEKGIIKPLEDVKGRGKSRLYSYKNLIEIGVFIYLNKVEISYELARQVLKKLRTVATVEIDEHGQFIERPFDVVKEVPYICVLGFLGGGMDITTYPESFSDKLSPEAYLSKRIKKAIKERDDITSVDDFAYYFILDVKNIVSFINHRID